jgi:preprotein translocase subunit YajC
MRLFEILALMPPTPAGTEPNPQGQMIQMIGMFVILGAMFYFLMIRPQQKQRKEHENMMKNIKSGDKILLSSGILGIVANVKEKTFIIKIAENVKVEVIKSAVTSLLKGEGETKTETK